MTRVGVYPGSFNPLTVAHLAIAEAARGQHRLDIVRLCISKVALAKESVSVPSLEDRLAVLRQVSARLDWLQVELTDAQLIADIAFGADLVIMGGDKWAQVNDPVFYNDSARERDEALARMPPLAIAPRVGVEIPRHARLDIAPELAEVSSSAIRSGRSAEWMVPEAAAFDAATGAWTDQDRYREQS